MFNSNSSGSGFSTNNVHNAVANYVDDYADDDTGNVIWKGENVTEDTVQAYVEYKLFEEIKVLEEGDNKEYINECKTLFETFAKIKNGEVVDRIVADGVGLDYVITGIPRRLVKYVHWKGFIDRVSLFVNLRKQVATMMTIFTQLINYTFSSFDIYHFTSIKLFIDEINKMSPLDTLEIFTDVTLYVLSQVFEIRGVSRGIFVIESIHALCGKDIKLGGLEMISYLKILYSPYELGTDVLSDEQREIFLLNFDENEMKKNERAMDVYRMFKQLDEKPSINNNRRQQMIDKLKKPKTNNRK
jgi:hypothetical protein